MNNKWTFFTVIFCSIFSPIIALPNYVKKTEKIKARYFFKKGKKNQEALEKVKVT